MVGDDVELDDEAAVIPRERRVQCMGPHGLHQMAYLEWGHPANPNVLVCVHGLTRNGRDFDFLARYLAPHYRVVCPDVVGRGQSDWLPVKADYAIPTYVADMVTLIARLDVPSVHWLGTSMGGLIGMVLASLPGSPIQRLILNDVGPMVTAASIARIAEYVGQDPLFATLEEAEAYVRAVSVPFGDLTHAQWRHLTDSAVKPVEEGFRFRYDPGLAEPFLKSPLVEDVSLWDVYDRITCPTLVVRGAESDLLLPETVTEMVRRGPRASLVEIPRVGHAPMLLDDDQIRTVADYLLSPGSK